MQPWRPWPRSQAEPGIYNVTDDDPSSQSVWLPAFAKFLGAPAPPQMTEADVKAMVGEDIVYYATGLSGASNAKAKRLLAGNRGASSG